MMLLGVHTSKWDSCAGEAIIRSMGGSTVQPDLEIITYSYYDTDHLNRKGFICMKNMELFEEIK